MARKKKIGGQDLLVLPTHIELISTKTGNVREFETSHAERILRLQQATHLGSYTIFNTELYTYNEGSRAIERIIRQSEPSEGSSIAE